MNPCKASPIIVIDYSFCMPFPFILICSLFTLQVGGDINLLVRYFGHSVIFPIFIDSFCAIFITFAVCTSNLIGVVAVFFDHLLLNPNQ